MSDDALDALRQRIDAIDEELLELFNRRAECAVEVAAVKRERSGGAEESIDYFRPDREAQVIQRAAGIDDPGGTLRLQLGQLGLQGMRHRRFSEVRMQSAVKICANELKRGGHGWVLRDPVHRPHNALSKAIHSLSLP